MKNITKDSLKDQIDLKNGSEGFIKVTDNPVSSLNSEQKVILNRKGNILFNQGDIESARRIFTTTGYSDGLTRVGDIYKEKNESLKALKQYGVYRCKMDSPYSIPENIDFTKCFYISNYYRCNNDIEKIKYALENDKLPVLICFKVFYTDIDNYHGVVGMYDKREQYDGYHAICLTGYTYIKNKLYFQFQNSWGKLWGENGFGYISEDYIKSSDLVPDIWIPTFIKS